LARQEAEPCPLGTLLVGAGHVDERDLREVLSRQVANTLVAAKLETTGNFVFVVDADPKQVDFITIDTHSVLLDISALGGEYCLAVEMLGQSNTVLVRNGDYQTLPRNPLTMGRDEFMVLVQVDGQRTVAEIGTASGLEEITVISILGKLAEAGVLLVKAERQSRAADDVELQAHRDSVWAEVSQLLDDIAEEPGGVPADAASPRDGPAELEWGSL
jgi:DNA-binding Lrp family transcriptional regulator